MTFALYDYARLVAPCDGWGVEGDEKVRFEAGAIGVVIELDATGAEVELLVEGGYTIGFVDVRFDQIERLPRRGEA
ncbi:MAG TPA: hypothetical protein VN238_19530 [Solirubrobacteraceae bacterium]|nr:hypothetical protein [Solirubrobacteraceae bacterium]